MELNQNNRFNRYLSVGGETVYSYTFGIFESEDLQVQRLRDKEVTTLVQGAGNDYIVTDVNNPAGGTVVLNEAAEADDIYAIYGINEYRKNTYSQNTGFRAADANRDMDQSIMIGQQNRRDIDQSIRAPLVDGPVDFTLPPREERIDKVIKFGEDGNLELDDRYPLVTDEEVTEDGLTVVWDGTDGKKVRTAREYIQAPQGTVASRPVPVAGMIRYNTDLLQLEAYDGITWVNVLTSGTGAPIQSTYIVQRPDGVLTDEQALSELDTGIMKSTTGTGVVSIAEAGVDYYGPGSAPGTDRDVYFNDDGDLNTTSSISIGVEGSVNINPEEGDVTISPEDGNVELSPTGLDADITIDPTRDVLISSGRDVNVTPVNNVIISPSVDAVISPVRDVLISPEEGKVTIQEQDIDGGGVDIITQGGDITLNSAKDINLLSTQLLSDVNIVSEKGNVNVSTQLGNINLLSNPLEANSHVVINGLNHPKSDGTTGQVIGTDGSGNLTFVDNTAGSNIFETIEVPGEDDIVAFGPNDTLHIQSGNNTLLETDAASKTLTISTTASGVTGAMQFNNNGSLGGTLGITTNGSDSLSVSGGINISGTSNLGNLSVTQNTISATNLGGDVIVSPQGNGHVVMSDLYYPNIDGLNGQVLTTDGSGNISWQQAGGVPGGLNTQIQYNNNGTFGGVTGATFVGGTLTLSPTHMVMSPSQSVTMSPTQDVNITPAQNINLAPVGGELRLRGNEWPSGPGTPGQVLTTDGAGTLSWADGGGGGGTPGGSGTQIQYRVSDNTFGGISGTSVSGSGIYLQPSGPYSVVRISPSGNGTDAAKVIISPTGLGSGAARVEINPQGHLILKGMTWPSSDGTPGQVLTTNGAGSLSWADGGGGAGRVLNVYQVVKTNTWSTTSTSPTEITGLRVTGIIPASTNSKFIILCHITYAGTNSPYAGFSISRQIGSGSTTYPYIGDAAGIRLRVSTTGFGYNIPSLSASINFMDSPGTTQPVSYWISGNTSSSTLYINRAGSSDSDAVAAYRGGSSIIILEIGS